MTWRDATNIGVAAKELFDRDEKAAIMDFSIAELCNQDCHGWENATGSGRYGMKLELDGILGCIGIGLSVVAMGVTFLNEPRLTPVTTNKITGMIQDLTKQVDEAKTEFEAR